MSNKHKHFECVDIQVTLKVFFSYINSGLAIGKVKHKVNVNITATL